MLSVVYTTSIVGIEASLVEVEVDCSSGMPYFIIVGLPDAAVNESKERIMLAIKNAGLPFPGGRIIVNLAPADIKKEGSSFDLPIALGILAATGLIAQDKIKSIVLGELSLDGSVRPVSGVLPSALLAATLEEKSIIAPEENGFEAAAVPEVEACTIKHLRDLPPFFNDGKRNVVQFNFPDFLHSPEYDFQLVKGQQHVKRALEVSAAGRHNILMSGAPGSGKSLMAKTLPTIFPQLTFKESLETTRIYSVRGYTSKDNPVIVERPFRAPHHSASEVGLIGGGSNPMPGEVSLAHNGVLFLDEFTEFKRHIIDALRQPLEDKKITVSRAKLTATFPADFMLVAACNPCPCGNKNHPYKECICSPLEIKRYMGKLSGPILDRIDLQVEVNPIKEEDFRRSDTEAETSAQIRERVEKAVEVQRKRFEGTKILWNGSMTDKQVKEFCILEQEVQELMYQAVQRFGLSARSYTRVLKVARTIADLAGMPNIERSHIAEAIQYRCPDSFR